MNRVSTMLTLALACAVVVALVCTTAPLRPRGKDALPGRLGALTLLCEGSQDLRRVGWIRDAIRPERGLPDWLRDGADGALVSTFGPAPAVLGTLGMVGLSPSDELDDEAIARRARFPAAAAIALATLLLFLALRTRVSPALAAAGALTAGLSVAGASLPGQALWQHTVVVPIIAAALAALWASEERPRLIHCVAPLVALALMVRPAILPLGVGVLVALAGTVRHRDDRRLVALLAVLMSLVAAAPLALWNSYHHGLPLPVGQWTANAQQTQQVFDFSPGHWLEGLGGLLVSPSRGVLLFAPIVVLGVVLGLRSRDRRDRPLAWGVLGTWALMAAFHKWWGGLAFGPRLLTEAIWVGALLAFGARPRVTPPTTGEKSARQRWLLGVAAVVTVLVGLVGAYRYDARKWDIPRNPDVDRSALWDVAESPIPALLFGPEPSFQIVEAPAGPFRFCDPGPLEAISAPRALRPLGPAGAGARGGGIREVVITSP